MAWKERKAPDLGPVPPEEEISEADAADRVELDSEEQQNRDERSDGGLDRTAGDGDDGGSASSMGPDDA